MASRDFSREHRAHTAVAVTHRHNKGDFLASLNGRLTAIDELVIKRAFEAVILFKRLEPRLISGRLIKDFGEIQAVRFPMIDTRTGVEQIGAANQLIKAADAQLRHDFAHFFSHKEEIVHHVLGLALKLLAQHRILRGHANRTGVQVAFAHHDAALDHQRCSRKTKLIGTQQCANHNIAACLHLAISLHADAATQTIDDQGLLGFRQTKLPRRASMLDRGDRRSACAAIMPGNHHMIRLGLGHACSHRAHANLRHELDRNRCSWIRILKVMNQLRQIFNRVDVVMRWRRDQAHTGD